MATGFSRYRRQQHLTALIGQQLWLSFHTADPGDRGLNECSDIGYVRWPVLITDWGLASLATPSQALSDTQVSVGPVSGNYNSGNPITYACLWSDETSQNEQYCEFIMELQTPVTLLDTQTRNIPIGDLVVSDTMTA